MRLLNELLHVATTDDFKPSFINLRFVFVVWASIYGDVDLTGNDRSTLSQLTV